MVTVKVKNSLSKEEIDNVVNIKEGNAGVFTTKASVKPGQTYTVELDPNATYREYVLITVANIPVGDTFSSDDAQEYNEIEVKKDGDRYVWKPTNFNHELGWIQRVKKFLFS
ncbi:hypothetical protein KC19_11G110200 [Ceratodon purpureus]|uniref:DUF7748 domain-containing protein n=1 Tax=Ceratodon purpureus TaxID=3225 RepID=A0A8T0GFW2_CERPU|nr:hypothetical protein KC19_11G110200 [Ceratodon purpureus]